MKLEYGKTSIVTRDAPGHATGRMAVRRGRRVGCARAMAYAHSMTIDFVDRCEGQHRVAPGFIVRSH